MVTTSHSASLPADPEKWSEKSKQTLSYHYKQEYTDIEYSCWRCKAACVFTAKDQQYTYEVRKANIDQRRSLCESCWSESHHIRNMIALCESEWAASKPRLQQDKDFLQRWLSLLIQLEQFVPYKPDTAKKNMLKKFLEVPNPSAQERQPAAAPGRKR
jgi:hypothetical protein